MRSNRLSAATPARKSHTHELHANNCSERAICEPLKRQTVDSTASLCTVSKTVHTDAVRLTTCRRNGSQIARSE
eukprot:5021369-Lingulodinium_polyedra.AAC.1